MTKTQELLVIFLTMTTLIGVGVLAGWKTGTKYQKMKNAVWCVDNGWAHYDSKTGKLVYHTLEYQQDFIDKLIPPDFFKPRIFGPPQVEDGDTTT